MARDGPFVCLALAIVGKSCRDRVGRLVQFSGTLTKCDDSDQTVQIVCNLIEFEGSL